MAKKVLINLSGHPLSDNARKRVKKYQIVNVDVPTIALDTLEGLVQGVQQMLAPLTGDNDVVTALKTGAYEIVPPGASSVALVTITILHAISGHFPKLRYFYRNADGEFVLSDTLDLQTLRTDARDSRFFL